MSFLQQSCEVNTPGMVTHRGNKGWDEEQLTSQSDWVPTVTVECVPRSMCQNMLAEADQDSESVGTRECL